MVTVSSAFISSRRERIIFSVLSASGCAFKAAVGVDVLRAVFEPVVLEPLGKTDLDLDNTDVARDHSFHCIANGPNPEPPTDHTTHVGLMVSIFQIAPHDTHECCLFALQLPSGFLSTVDERFSFMPVRKTHA